MKEIKLPFIATLALTLLSIFLLGFLARIGQTILAPLFFGFLMAILFLPFSNVLERRMRFSRTLATFSSVLIMITVLGATIYFFATQLSDFSEDFPALQKQLTRSLLNVQVWVSRTFHFNIVNQWRYINQGIEKLLSSTGVILGFTFTMFSSMLAFLAFSVLFFIFILNYRRILYQFIVSVFSEKHYAKVHEIIDEVQRIIKQYISGLFIQIMIISILTAVTLSIFGVKYAILLGVLTGIMNVIPYVGIFVSCLIACVIAFVTGGSTTIFVLLAYTAIHLIDSNIILPLVVGSKVKINALFTFIGLLVGEALWGISGMFLSIPFLAILKIIFERIEGLESWGKILGEESKINRTRRKYKITKKIILEEKE